MKIRSMIIIRLIIKSPPHYLSHFHICLTARLSIPIIIQMKGPAKDAEEDSDSDEFDFEWLTKKRAQTQELPREQPLKERLGSDLDGKKTVKYKQDPVMNNMFEKILRKRDKFEEEVFQPVQDRKDLYQYNPHIICGKLINIRTCTSAQKKSYSLEDEGYCQAMQINQKVTVVLVGKVGYTPIEAINANLFVPKELYEYMGEKQAKGSPPERLVKTSDNRFVVWIKREIKGDKSQNVMNYPFLILDPNNLLYPSYLCSWIDCKRLTTLSNYIQGEKDVNEATVFGSTCHRLLQWLSQKRVSVLQYRKNKRSIIEQLYEQMLYDMYLVDRTFIQFIEVCNVRLENLVNFYDRYIEKGEQIEIDKDSNIFLKITHIIQSEYMFRSKFFGLKGKVDLLLAGQRIDRNKNKKDFVYIPMQLKTGKKASETHKKQTEIYNILVREKYKEDVVGLLYYSDSDMKFIRNEDPISAYDIIILHRNQVAQNLVRLYQKGTIQLPSFPNSFSQCNYCPQSTVCELSYYQIQQSKEETSVQDVPSKYHKTIQENYRQFSKKDIEYVSKWFKVIHLQEMEFKRLNTGYWKMGIANFMLSYTQFPNFTKKEAKVRLELTHKCRSKQELQVFEDYYKTSMKVRINSNQICMIEGCKIISTQNNETNDRVFRILVEMNNLDIQYDDNKLGYFLNTQQNVDVEIQTFQNSFFSVMRNTVLTLAQNKTYLKDLLINDTQKKFEMDIDSDEDYTIPKAQYSIREEQLEGFNEDQKKAYKKSILEDKFCLVEGMPGTGKTELIIRLIQKFSKMKKTLLITTFTNRALDNILERVIQSGKVEKWKIIREGAQYACSKTLKQYTSHGVSLVSLQEYKKFYGKKSIWFVTLNSLYIHHLPKMFDVGILDEASQCLQPTCIDGLLRCRKFILIGDYKQLQPLVKSKQAYRKGMCLSLFERLCKLYPQNSISLKKQYRMNYKIMALSNKLVYNGQLQLANEKIKQKTIVLPPEWKHLNNSFYSIISPENSIVFINYDPIIDSITKQYKEREPMIRKIIEAELPAYIFRTYVNLSISPSCISVIAAMNSSVNRILDMLKQSKTIQDNHGCILTIDKSQGIDKDIIVLLIERGNEQFVENPRRLNVALTRAKSKLIIIGSDEHLSKMKVWEGTLGRLLKDYQTELTKAMIEEMMNALDRPNQLIM